MLYAENAKTKFKESLEIFEHSLERGHLSKVDQTNFCVALHKYLENYVLWCNCDPAAANAYQVFVKSTPLWELLQLPPNKWEKWLVENIKQTAEV
ncbi:MAG: hypothetical protein HRT87_12170 [Legionellales bacterium]|nr:hypothetical protein [Legionellales bacterium]